jgi:hypothetical protein
VNRDPRPPPGPSSVTVHIDELVLHGFAPADGHTIADAVRAELARRLAGAAECFHTSPSEVPIDRIDAGSITIRDPARPAAIGAQVGAALGAALSGRGT